MSLIQRPVQEDDSLEARVDRLLARLQPYVTSENPTEERFAASGASILNKAQNNARNAAAAAVPPNVRAYFKVLANDQSPWTERNLTPDQVVRLREVAKRGIERTQLENVSRVEEWLTSGRGGLQEYTDLARDSSGNVVRDARGRRVYENKIRHVPERPWPRMLPDHINYRDYEEGPRDWGERTLIDSVTDPVRQLETTIGSAVLTLDQAGNVILEDRFDFNGPQPNLDSLKNSWEEGDYYQILRDLGGMIAPEGGNRGFDIRVNLGNPNTWDSLGDSVTQTERALQQGRQ